MAELLYQDHAEHLEQLQEALNLVFPVLCFSQDDISSHMEEVQTPYNYKFMRIERAPGQAALVCANPGRGDKPWDLKYLVPTQWPERYPIMQAAIERLIDEVTQLELPGLYMTLKEEIPSHNNYFSAIMGLAGFDIQPRARFIAPIDLIDRLTLPAPPRRAKR